MRNSTLSVYPDGAAAKAYEVPTVPFTPAPDYASIAKACGCHAETVELAEDLPGALARALDTIRTDNKQALVNVKIGQDDGEK